jgi:mannose-6-phosphate isomerase-like protein (cupin superfamily)
MNEVVMKPWGTYQVISCTSEFNVKKIVIYPKSQPSYQYHAKRAEHWIIISGCGQVTIDDQIFSCKSDDQFYVPIGSKHRITNTSSEHELVFIEIQTGTYFGEDDIVRIQDDYSRS